MPSPRPGARRDSRLFTVLVTVTVVLCALPIALVIALSGAPATIVATTLLAAVPVGPLVACYLWLDRYEPEPRLLLALGLAWGGFVATLAALLLQGVGGIVAGATREEQVGIWAPITEEGTKGLFLLVLLWWRRHELDGILDGIVYAGMIGIGFAFTENILYLAAAYNGTEGLAPGGLAGLTGTFVVRCIASPFAHPLFTTFIGIGVGIAVSTRSAGLRVLAPLSGYAAAVFAHGLWNRSTLGGIDNFVLVYLTLMVPAFVAVIGFAVWRRVSERAMLTSALTDAAARGLIPATDIDWVVDLKARKAARAYAKSRGGKAGLSAMESYQQAAIELGYLHHRYLRGTAPRDFASRGHDYVDRLQSVRPHIAFPGQVVPTR
ncbi:MAG: PrsW family intramembrane metalloprotease [Nocardioides sp.]